MSDPSDIALSFFGPLGITVGLGLLWIAARKGPGEAPPVRPAGYAAPLRCTPTGGQRGPDVEAPRNVPTTARPCSAVLPRPPTPITVQVILREGPPPP